MAFTRNGDIVTQTGTDDGVAGLYDAVATANKTRLILGSLRIYRIANTTIVQNGTWNINANTDQLCMNFGTGAGNRALTVNGTLNLDSRFTFNGYERVEQVLPLVIKTEQVTFTGCVIVGNGGRINQRCPIKFLGGDVSTNGALMVFESGAYHFIRDGSVRMVGGTGTNKQIRYKTGSSFDADGFNLSGLNFTFEDINYVNTNRLSVDSVAGFGMVFSSAYSFDEVLVFRGFDFNAVDTIEYKNVTGTIPTRHEDPIKPVEDYVLYRQTKSEAEQTDFTSTLKYTGSTVDGTALTDSRMVIFDTPTTAGTIFSGFAREYNANAEQNQVILHDGTESIIRSTATQSGFFHRGKDGSSSIFDWRSRAYGYLELEATIDLSSAGLKEQNNTYTVDTAITERDGAVVQAYTILTTAEQSYDWARYDESIDLVTSHGITHDGSSVDFGALNVTLSGTPTVANRPMAFSDDGTAVTVYVGDTGVFVGNISTTGDFFLVEGATVNGSVRAKDGVTFRVSGFPDGREAGVVTWLQTDGENNAFGSSALHSVVTDGVAEVVLEPDTEYFLRAEALGYRRAVYRIDTTTQGNLVVDLQEYGNEVDGVVTPILPDTLTAEQQAIADHFAIVVYNEDQPASYLYITLPSDYDTDTERWDSGSATFSYLSTDFIPIAYRLKELLLHRAMLQYEHTINIEDADIIFEVDFNAMALRQNPSNVDGVEINFGGFSVRRVGDSLQVNDFIDRSQGTIRIRAIQPSASLPALASIQSTLVGITESVVTNRDDIEGRTATQEEFNVLMDNTTEAIQDKYKGAGGGGTGGLTTEQGASLDNIEEAVVTNRATNFHADLTSYTGKAEWGQAPTQDEFNVLMENTTSAIQDLYKGTGGTGGTGSAPSTVEIVQAILDAPYGTRLDGSALIDGTLGQHLFLFYPPEIIKQFLTYTLDGTTDPTRLTATALTYGEGTLGDALRQILDIVTEVRRTNGLIEDDGSGDDRFTAKALEQAPASTGGGTGGGGLTTAQAEQLDSIEESVVTNRDELTKLTQDEMNTLLLGTTTAVQDLYKSDNVSIDVSQVVDAILDVRYGKKSDGTTDVGSGTLGEYFHRNYPESIARQILESVVDGTLQAVRGKTAGSYANNSVGEALERTLNTSSGSDVSNGISRVLNSLID